MTEDRTPVSHTVRPVPAAAATSLRDEFRMAVEHWALDAAKAAVLEHGWQHVRLAALARETGISRSRATLRASATIGLRVLAVAVAGADGAGGDVVCLAVSSSGAGRGATRRELDGHSGVVGDHRGHRLVAVHDLRARVRGTAHGRDVGAAVPSGRLDLSGRGRRGDHVRAGRSVVRGEGQTHRRQRAAGVGGPRRP